VRERTGKKEVRASDAIVSGQMAVRYVERALVLDSYFSISANTHVWSCSLPVPMSGPIFIPAFNNESRKETQARVQGGE